MPDVHLRPVTRSNLITCLDLDVTEEQRRFVATNARSLAQAYVQDTLVPLAIYPGSARGWEQDPPVPMVGFTMYELEAGVGFILRLMIDQRHQGHGYAKSAMIEVIRRLRLHPEAEVIATSHQHDNTSAARLYASLGFVSWEIPWARNHQEEAFLALSDSEL